ncbi:MAG: nitrogenase component 1 [Megasphaera sp.]|jgi:hypothetical protein|nr:nitrogenase component 1 [Megasphaera sp.]
MLRKINGTADPSGACLPIKEAAFPEPFYDGLQYAPPARGTWNIVHTTLCVPETHQIYICGLGCLRGCTLTAAEVEGGIQHFSSIIMEEREMYEGTMEDAIVSGVKEILDHLPYTPKAVFMYPSCIHHIMGSDMDGVYDILRKAYTHIRFVPCWMDPMRRRTNLPPELRTRSQVYALLPQRQKTRKSVNIIGSNLPVAADSMLVRLVQESGAVLRQLPLCKTYDEYEKMGESFLNIAYDPVAEMALHTQSKRLGQEKLFLPSSYVYEDIEKNMDALAAALDLPQPDYSGEIAACEAAFKEAKTRIGNRPVAIDAAAVFMPFSLARTLVEHGFNVQRVYADVMNDRDKIHVEWLKKHAPELMVYSIRNAKMRVLPHDAEGFLGIGQKAGYYTGTHQFVDMAEGGGLVDFAGIRTLLAWLCKAAVSDMDPRAYIRVKGWRFASCRQDMQ